MGGRRVGGEGVNDVQGHLCTWEATKTRRMKNLISAFSHKQSHSHGQDHLRYNGYQRNPKHMPERSIHPTWNCNSGPQPSTLHSTTLCNIKALPEYFFPLMLMHHLCFLRQDTWLEKVIHYCMYYWITILNQHLCMDVCWRPRGALLTAPENLRSANHPPLPSTNHPCVPVLLASCVSLWYKGVRDTCRPLLQECGCVLMFVWHRPPQICICIGKLCIFCWPSSSQ